MLHNTTSFTNLMSIESHLIPIQLPFPQHISHSLYMLRPHQYINSFHTTYIPCYFSYCILKTHQSINQTLYIAFKRRNSKTHNASRSSQKPSLRREEFPRLSDRLSLRRDHVSGSRRFLAHSLRQILSRLSEPTPRPKVRSLA